MGRVATVALALLGLGLLAGLLFMRLDSLQLQPVLSGSMRPGIQPGDLAVVQPVRVSKLRVGDVIAYLPPGRTTPVMHRIVSINAHGMVTKGDANPVADPWGRARARQASVDRLVAVLPEAGWLATVREQAMAGIGVALLVILLLTVVWRSDRTTGASADRHDPTTN